MAKSKCSLTDFNKASDDELDTKATAVKNGLTASSATLPAPPVPPATLTTQITAYSNTYSAYKRGGLDQKPAFETAKNTLIDSLTQNAEYVDEVANGDEEIIVAAGYVPTKTTGSPKPQPAQPTGVTAKRGQAIGEMFVECPAVDNAEFYGLIVTQGAPLSNVSFTNGQLIFEGPNPVNGIDLNKGRKKHLQGMVPGQMYYFYMYAGNATGLSALSAVVQLMAA